MADVGKQLQVGQVVTLKEMEVGYQVLLLTAGQPGVTVVAVGPDSVVFDDDAAGVKTRIPMHLIRSVSVPEAAAAPQEAEAAEAAVTQAA